MYKIYNMKKHTSIILISALLLVGFLFLLSCTQAKADSKSPAELYAQYCSSCHGVDLRGGNAQSLVDGIWQFGDGQGYVSRNIQFGIPHLGMPSYEASLSKDEIKLLVDYLYEEQANAGVVKPDPPAILESIHYTINSEIWVDELDIPWAICFLNKDSALVTERPGGLRVIVKGELQDKAVEGTPSDTS